MATMKEQYEHCKRKFLWKAEYYKLTLRTVLGSLGVITIIILAVVGYSYQPIRDIATLKVEVKVMNEKLDVIIKNGEKEQKSEKTEKHSKTEKSVMPDEIRIDSLALASPALSGICAIGTPIK